MERFSGHDRAVDHCTDYRVLVGSLFGILRTVPNRILSGIGTCYVELFRNVPLIVQFFTVSGGTGTAAGKHWHVVQIRTGSQYPVLCLFDGLPWLVHRGTRLRAGPCGDSVVTTRAEKRGSRHGADAAANVPLCPAAECLSRHRPTDDLGDDEPRKNSAIASTIGLVDMAAQAGKLLDYSAHARESFTAITVAYVLINAFIMLVMNLVERKIRLPGNMGANNVRI